MKDEIKEHMQNCVDREESCLLNSDNTELLLDYITNLQGKVNQYENPDDLTLFYMWLDVKAKDKMKELEDNLYSANQAVNELLDVKEENERLKELCDKYEEEHKTAFKLWTMKMEEMPNYEEFVDYKSRCEKAVKLIDDLDVTNSDFDFYIMSSGAFCDPKIELKSILNGDDKSVKD